MTKPLRRALHGVALFAGLLTGCAYEGPPYVAGDPAIYYGSSGYIDPYSGLPYWGGAYPEGFYGVGVGGLYGRGNLGFRGGDHFGGGRGGDHGGRGGGHFGGGGHGGGGAHGGGHGH